MCEYAYVQMKNYQIVIKNKTIKIIGEINSTSVKSQIKKSWQN